MLSPAQGGPWFLLLIATLAAAAPLIARSGRSQVISLLLTTWFGIGTLFGLLGWGVPFPKPLFLIALGLAAIGSVYVTWLSRGMTDDGARWAHRAAVVPCLLALVGIVSNLMS